MFNVLTNWGALNRIGLIAQILAWTAALFFAPMCLLGTISPLVTRLAVGDMAHAGRTAGRIYAWSCVGAIAGTFATGWWLIAAIEVKSVLLVIAAVLMILATIIGRPWRRPGELFGSAIVLGAAVVGILYQQSKKEKSDEYYKETNYYTIRAYETTHGDEPVTALSLDRLVHSYAKPHDPEYLGYEHEWVQADFAQLMADRTNGSPRILIIGGGGYTFPRWLEAKLPKSIIEVAEIDPGVTEAAHQAMGLSRKTRIQSFHMDGRQYVEERAPKISYQLIVQDAVNDLSVPYHIMTKEYNDAVKALLDPDGVYLLTVIDEFERGQLMRSAVRTMKQTFPHVGLLAASDLWEPASPGGRVGRQVWVIYGSQRPFDQTALASAVQKQTQLESKTRMMPPNELDTYVAAGPPIILTDTYAPVDNLISIVFRLR
jgi:spermidine synthase